MFTEERHCRDKYDQNGVRTKAAEGCFFLGGGETKVTEGFFYFGSKNVSLLDPAARYVRALPVILDLNPCAVDLFPPYMDIFRFDITAG